MIDPENCALLAGGSRTSRPGTQLPAVPALILLDHTVALQTSLCQDQDHYFFLDHRAVVFLSELKWQLRVEGEMY